MASLIQLESVYEIRWRKKGLLTSEIHAKRVELVTRARSFEVTCFCETFILETDLPQPTQIVKPRRDLVRQDDFDIEIPLRAVESTRRVRP